MQIAVKAKAVRWLLVCLEIAAFLALTVLVGKACLADMLAGKPTSYNLERAVSLDPTNADYLMKLGGLYEYSPSDLQLGKAEASYRRAAHLDPYDPQTWLDLSASLQFEGRADEAEACRRQVDLLAPNLPAYQWPIANFYLLQGNTDEAFRHFRLVLAGTSQYDNNVFGLAWKASDDPGKILHELIPERVNSEFSYLDFLLAQHRLDEGGAVWKRVLDEREDFAPDKTSPYIDRLISAHRPEEAYQVWAELLKRGLIRHWSAPSEGNLVSDGDFEDDLLNFGFTWRVVPLEGVFAGLDTSTYHSPSHSLMVQFSGKENVAYHNVFQFVKVTPGQAYRLQAVMKTEGITTDSGPRLQVYDAYNPAALDKSTEPLTGSTDAWTPLLLDFVVGPKTDLLVVRINRAPSGKIDNLIAGKVWLDDVKLTALQQQ